MSFATAGASGILPSMIIGVGLDARLGLPFGQLREVAREAARLGFESLWTPAGGVPDSFHVCSAWSQDTSLRTGISVVPAARMWTAPGLGGPGGDAGPAVGRTVRARHRHRRLRTEVLGVGRPARPADRDHARVRQRDPRAAGRAAGRGRADHRPGGRRLGRARLAAVHLARAGSAAGRPGGAGRARSRRCSGWRARSSDGALLNWATPGAHRGQPGAGRRGCRAGGPRAPAPCR